MAKTKINNNSKSAKLFVLLRHSSNNARLYTTFIFATEDLEETCKGMKNDTQ